MRKQMDFAEAIASLYRETKGQGILMTSVSQAGTPNIMTLGWGLYGWEYRSHPVAVIAVRPDRYTFRLLEEVREFTLCVPTNKITDAVSFCGTKSGRDYDKFTETGLTAIPSTHVKPPCIKECPIHVECRIYHRGQLLTEANRKKPPERLHTIYYGEVLGTYKMAERE